jgi:GNAT superfamily N-acetyltransferase
MMTEHGLDQTEAEALVKSMVGIPNDGVLTPVIRSVSADDKEALRRMLCRLSPRTIYRRFHTPYPSVPGWMLDLMIDVGHRDRESLVAVAGGEIVGHAMYVRENGGEAEVAVVVEDRWQSKGVGKLLLLDLAREASRRGIGSFTGLALGENRRVLDLTNAVFAEVGYTVREGLYDIRMPLRTLKSVAVLPRTIRYAA